MTEPGPRPGGGVLGRDLGGSRKRGAPACRRGEPCQLGMGMVVLGKVIGSGRAGRALPRAGSRRPSDDQIRSFVGDGGIEPACKCGRCERADELGGDEGDNGCRRDSGECVG